MSTRNRLLSLLLALGSLSLAGCDIDVKDEGKQKNVDVRTAFGDVSVRASGEEGPDTGLPVYPGAEPMMDEDNDRESADVKVGTSFFAIKVAAAKYSSADAPQKILDFYRDELTAFGAVTECKGEVDFEDDAGPPVCKEKPASKEIQLVTGTENDQHIVSVKPRGEGSEFAVVAVKIGDSG